MKFMADSPHKKSKILCMSLHFQDFGVCVCVVFVFVEKPFFFNSSVEQHFLRIFFCEFRQNTFIWLLQYPFLSIETPIRFFLIFHWLCPWVHAWNKESRVFFIGIYFFLFVIAIIFVQMIKNYWNIVSMRYTIPILITAIISIDIALTIEIIEYAKINYCYCWMLANIFTPFSNRAIQSWRI